MNINYQSKQAKCEMNDWIQQSTHAKDTEGKLSTPLKAFLNLQMLYTVTLPSNHPNKRQRYCTPSRTPRLTISPSCRPTLQ